MLAVVEDQQQLAVAHELDDRLDDGTTGVFHDAEHRRDSLRHEPRVGDRRELDEPDAIGKLVEHVSSDLQRQPRLAEAAHSEQREQPRAPEQLADFGLAAFAANERRHLLRQVVGRRFERAQCGEFLAKLGMHRLVDVLRTREVAQPHAAEVAQRHARRQSLADGLDDRLREQDLATVRGAHDAGRAVDGAAEIIVVAGLYGTGMQPAADMQSHVRGRCRIGQRDLDRERRAERVGGLTEHGMEPIARGLHNAAVVLDDGRTGERVVTRHRLAHLRGLGLP